MLSDHECCTCAAAVRRRVSRPQQESAPPPSLEVVASVARRLPARYRLAVPLAVACHLRQGEVLGLLRDDFSRDLSGLEVLRTLTGHSVMSNPDSMRYRTGARIVSIPGDLRPALADHLALFAHPQSPGWLFPNAVGDAISPRQFSQYWLTAQRHASVMARFHDLRKVEAQPGDIGRLMELIYDDGRDTGSTDDAA